MKAIHTTVLAVLTSLTLVTPGRAVEGDSARGQRVFRACAACHSLLPGRHMTGPSLAELWDRKAGSVESFHRYSPALKSSGVVWNDKTLDAWIENPQHVVPGNQMTFPGIKDAQPRADLLAYLKKATRPDAPQSHAAENGSGMMGMMHGGAVPNLKQLEPGQRVQTIRYCKDTYTVTTADGRVRKFWERNLRLKTDSSGDGPKARTPALVPAGMMGDRADVIFADPSEISAFIAGKC